MSDCRRQGKDNGRERELIEKGERHAFWWTPEFVYIFVTSEFMSIELFKVRKYPNTGKVLKNF